MVGLSDREFWLLMGMIVAAIIGSAVSFYKTKYGMSREIEPRMKPVLIGLAAGVIAWCVMQSGNGHSHETCLLYAMGLGFAGEGAVAVFLNRTWPDFAFWKMNRDMSRNNKGAVGAFMAMIGIVVLTAAIFAPIGMAYYSTIDNQTETNATADDENDGVPPAWAIIAAIGLAAGICAMVLWWEAKAEKKEREPPEYVDAPNESPTIAGGHVPDAKGK